MANSINRSYFRKANDSVNMTDVADMCGLRVYRGAYLKCPFHKDDTPSLKLYAHRFYCFGCHAGGDVVDFVSRYHGESQMGALRRINDAFNLGLPLDKRPTLRDQRSTDRTRTATEIEKYINDRVLEILKALEYFWMTMYTEADKMSMEDYQHDNPLWINAIKNKPLYAEQWAKWEQEVRAFERTAD